MARTVRIKSVTGYYHVINRGVGRQVLFENAQDYSVCLSYLSAYTKEYDVSCIAYCLMENHMHLLLKDRDNNLGDFMRRFSGRYARYFNSKYDRVGHLFQERYHSEAIENEQALIAVTRYIFMNPEKAGIAAAKTYRWSSIRELYGLSSENVTDVDALRTLIGDEQSLDQLIFGSSEDPYTDFDLPYYDADRIDTIFKEAIGTPDGTILQTYPKKKRNAAIHILRKKGLSVRTIERKTGISRGVIQRVF